MRKKISCVMLTLVLVVGSVFTPYQKAYATGFVPAIGIEEVAVGAGLALTAPQALGIALLLGGVAVSTKVLADNWDEINASITAMDNRIEAWLQDAMNRTIDTTSEVWDKLKDWAKAQLEANAGAVEGYPTLMQGEYVFNPTNTSGWQYKAYVQGLDKWVYCARTDSNTWYVVGLQSFTPKVWNNITGYYSTSCTSFAFDTPSYYETEYWGKRVYYYDYSAYCKSPAELDSCYHSPSLSDAMQKAYDILCNVIDVAKNPYGMQNVGYPVENLGENQEAGVIGLDGTGVITLPDTLDIDGTIDGVIAGEMDMAQAIEACGAQAIATDTDTDISYPIENGVVLPEPIVIEEKPTIAWEIQGLEKLFPFCIPFDIYNLFSKLGCAPEAPHFTWNIPYEGDHMIDIDLSPFNGVAQILRDMLVILFCVGLANKTRELIRG